MRSTWSKGEVVTGVICLAVGSVGQLAQYLVTPLGAPDDPAAKNVARALAHPGAMQAAAWLDLSILFFLPALVVVAAVAGARLTRLGRIAAGIALGSTLPGLAYVLAPDVLYVLATHGDTTARTIDAYTNAPLLSVATLVFLIGHVLGMILLAVVLWRSAAVPRWAAVCLGLYPILEIAGPATGVKPVGVLAYLLLTTGFAACGAALLRDRAPARAAAPPAALAHS